MTCRLTALRPPERIIEGDRKPCGLCVCVCVGAGVNITLSHTGTHSRGTGVCIQGKRVIMRIYLRLVS